MGWQRRVLVAEDHQDIRRLLSFALGNDDIEVVEAADGDEALELAGHAHPQALVTDLLMPGLDGRDLVLALRAQREFASLPVLLLTANPDHPAALELEKMPNVQVMSKPPSWRQVALTVTGMLKGLPEPQPAD